MSTASTTDSRFTRPLYSVTEAASYVGVPRTTFDTWVSGYERQTASRSTVRGPLLTRVGGGQKTVPFIGLVEGAVLAAFRETGLPMQRIRPAIERLREEGHLEHALASRRLYTDGAQVLFDYAATTHDKQLRLLTVVVSGQRVFHEVIDRYLKRITYGDDGWAARIVLPATKRELLVVDPDRAFGQPTFIRGGARLVDIRSRVEAGESLRGVARDFGVPLADVRDALDETSAAAA